MKRKHTKFQQKLLNSFFMLIKVLKLVAIGPGTEFFRKNRHFCLGHMIHQNGPEFPQDHENAIQKILRPLVLEL